MMELIQLPYSPFCIVTRRILEYAGSRFKTTNITAASDRSNIWRLTRERYYQVPILRDGRTVVFETNEDSQVIAKYLDTKLRLGLFPREVAGIQQVLWHYFEHEVEAVGFKLNNAHYREWLPSEERLPFMRYKERRFGRGCLEQWREQEATLQAELVYKLAPTEQMLLGKPFLVGSRPLFVDFDLYGMLGNYLYGGCTALPESYPLLRDWYDRMTDLKHPPT
jgi:glutathione S-transferase